MDDGDVGVLERSGGPRFLKEAAFALFVHDELGGEDLDRYLALELHVERAVDDPHTAATQLFQDLVVGEASLDHVLSSPVFRDCTRALRPLQTKDDATMEVL